MQAKIFTMTSLNHTLCLLVWIWAIAKTVHLRKKYGEVEISSQWICMPIRFPLTWLWRPSRGLLLRGTPVIGIPSLKNLVEPSIFLFKARKTTNLIKVEPQEEIIKNEDLHEDSLHGDRISPLSLLIHWRNTEGTETLCLVV